MMAKNKGGCAFSMVVISKLPHAESGPNDHPISDWSVLTDSTFIFFSDRLLDFDRNATRRTEVVDDESDYYKGVDEAKVREQRHGSRLNKKFTLNLESGKILIIYQSCENTSGLPLNNCVLVLATTISFIVFSVV